MIRTALFGGSFNPIHLGHTGVAQCVTQQGWADEVWLMVSPHNPLKRRGALFDEEMRYRWTELAVRSMPKIEASRFEFALPRPSYTYDTLAAIERAYPDRTFSLIIGADNWHIFDHWAHHDEILLHHPIIIYPREGFPIDTTNLPPSVHLIDAPLFPYSSTEIRERLHKGEPTDGMLADKVRCAILEDLAKHGERPPTDQ